MEKHEINTSANKEALLLARIYAFLLNQARKRDLLKSSEEITSLPDSKEVDPLAPELVRQTSNLLANRIDMHSNPAHDIIHPGGYEHGGMDHDQ